MWKSGLLKTLVMLSFLAGNQTGAIGFGLDRYNTRLMEPKKAAEAGGKGKTKEEEEEEDEEEDDDDELEAKSSKNKKTAKPGAKADENEEEEEEDESEFSKLPLKTQNEIKKLRKENQKLRTKNKTNDERVGQIEKSLRVLKGEEVEEDAPEAVLSKSQARAEQAEVNAAFAEMAVEHEIPKGQFKYFKFLMNEALEELGEDEQMDEEQLQSIVDAAKKSKPKAANSTSVGGEQKGGKTPKKSDEVTVEQFKKMTIMEKSSLFVKNPELYKELFDEAGV